MVRDAVFCSDEALLSLPMKVAVLAADRQQYPREALHMGNMLCPSLDKVLCPPAYLLCAHTIPVPHWNPLYNPLSPFMFLLK